MDVKVLAICDEEKQYALKLMEAFSERKNLGFQIHAFSGVDELMQFAARTPMEILLITGRLMSEKFHDFSIGKIILLSDGEVYEEFSDYESIYKYQSAEHILKEVLCYYAFQSFQPGLLPMLIFRISQSENKHHKLQILFFRETFLPQASHIPRNSTEPLLKYALQTGIYKYSHSLKILHKLLRPKAK